MDEISGGCAAQADEGNGTGGGEARRGEERGSGRGLQQGQKH